MTPGPGDRMGLLPQSERCPHSHPQPLRRYHCCGLSMRGFASPTRRKGPWVHPGAGGPWSGAMEVGSRASGCAEGSGGGGQALARPRLGTLNVDTDAFRRGCPYQRRKRWRDMGNRPRGPGGGDRGMWLPPG